MLFMNHIKLCEGRVTLDAANKKSLVMFMFNTKTFLVEVDESEEENICLLPEVSFDVPTQASLFA